MTQSTELKQNMDNATVPAMGHLVEIKSDGETLFGSLLVASGQSPRPTVILLHGFPGSEKHGDLAHAFLRAGYNTLSFSYRGSWGSGGVYRFQHVIEDVGAAVSFLRDHAAAYYVDVEQMILVGHSVGGWAALMAATADPSIKKVVSFAGFNCGRFVKDVLENDDFLIMLAKQSWEHEAKSLNANGDELIDELLANQEQWDNTAHADQLHGRSILLIAAEKDTIAAPMVHHEPVVQAYEAADIDLTTMIIKGEDHNFYGNRIELADAILSFIAS